MSISKIVTIWYEGLAIIAEEMLFILKVVILVWTVFKKFSFHAIKFSPVTKWRKWVSILIKHFFLNTPPSFCSPKTKVMTQIKLEIIAEIFQRNNQIRFNRTRNWCCILYLRIIIKTNIYNLICIQQGTCLFFKNRIGMANICQLVCCFSTYQHVIVND